MEKIAIAQAGAVQLELAQTMGILRDLIYRVRKGEHGINGRFIIGATRAFPGYNLDDLFYVAPEESQNDGK